MRGGGPPRRCGDRAPPGGHLGVFQSWIRLFGCNVLIFSERFHSILTILSGSGSAALLKTLISVFNSFVICGTKNNLAVDLQMSDSFAGCQLIPKG